MTEDQATIETTEELRTEDWRAEVGEALPTLKVLDGESKEFEFADEGQKKTHPDYGTSIVFQVMSEGEKLNFYVRDTNYDLQRQIKALGTLTGLRVVVSRTGAKKSDTRYEIRKVDKFPVEKVN